MTNEKPTLKDLLLQREQPSMTFPASKLFPSNKMDIEDYRISLLTMSEVATQIKAANDYASKQGFTDADTLENLRCAFILAKAITKGKATVLTDGKRFFEPIFADPMLLWTKLRNDDLAALNACYAELQRVNAHYFKEAIDDRFIAALIKDYEISPSETQLDLVLSASREQLTEIVAKLLPLASSK